MQNELLAQYPSPSLRVYAIWVPMLAGDEREDWNGTVMSDPRVVHFWDGDLQAGGWFANQVDGFQGIAWDVYYLYGPEATWESVPSPLVGSGGTIYGERGSLEIQVNALFAK